MAVEALGPLHGAAAWAPNNWLAGAVNGVAGRLGGVTENKRICLVNFAVNVKHGISHAKLTPHKIPPLFNWHARQAGLCLKVLLGGFGMTPGCVAVCSRRRLLASRHLALSFP